MRQSQRVQSAKQLTQQEAFSQLEQPLVKAVQARSALPIVQQTLVQTMTAFQQQVLEVDRQGQNLIETLQKLAIFNTLLVLTVEKATPNELRLFILQSIDQLTAQLTNEQNRIFFLTEENTVSIISMTLQNKFGEIASKRSAMQLLDQLIYTVNPQSIDFIPLNSVVYTSELIYNADPRTSGLAFQYYIDYYRQVQLLRIESKLGYVAKQLFSVASSVCLIVANFCTELDRQLKRAALQIQTMDQLTGFQQLEQKIAQRVRCMALLMEFVEPDQQAVLLNRVQQLLLSVIHASVQLELTESVDGYFVDANNPFRRQFCSCALDPKHIRSLVPGESSQSNFGGGQLVWGMEAALFLLNVLTQFFKSDFSGLHVEGENANYHDVDLPRIYQLLEKVEPKNRQVANQLLQLGGLQKARFVKFVAPLHFNQDMVRVILKEKVDQEVLREQIAALQTEEDELARQNLEIQQRELDKELGRGSRSLLERLQQINQRAVLEQYDSVYYLNCISPLQTMEAALEE